MSKSPHSKPVKTRQQVREAFELNGISISEWARLNNFSASLVHEVLTNPRRKCLRGKSHQVAVLLGLKHGHIATSANEMNVVQPPARAATASKPQRAGRAS